MENDGKQLLANTQAVEPVTTFAAQQLAAVVRSHTRSESLLACSFDFANPFFVMHDRTRS